MANHRYWRLNLTTNWGGGLTILAGLELRATVGGANMATPGNGTASSSTLWNAGSNPLSRAFDSDSTSVCGLNPTGAWVKWDFGAGNEKTVAQIAIDQRQGVDGFATTAFFRTGTFEYSDNNSTWFALLTATNVPQANGTYTYNAPVIISATATLQPQAISLTPTALVAYGGATAQITDPSPKLAAYSGATAALTPSLPTLIAYGHDSTGELAADLTAPSPTLSAYGGATARLKAPRPTAGATGTVTIAGHAALTAPRPTLSATGTKTETASADLSITTPYSLIGYGGAVCSISVTGSPTLQATGTTGIVGSAMLTCPLFELTASATLNAHGSANLVAPSPKLGGQGQAWLVAPSATLTAIGTATITATYEAYAINLKHTPRGNEPPVDETTRYTNFPFTHVIRHQNSYYGVNGTGLYLLEGTTDDAVPISYAVKTGTTDFKQPEKKTVASAYLGGRVGPGTTLTLHVGEGAGMPYSYTTPRGQLAQNYRQVFGKGNKARYYSLALSGSDVLELDNIELDVKTLTRRI